MKTSKTGWGKSFHFWRVKIGKKTTFSGTRGECCDFIRKNKGKGRLVEPNKPGNRG